MLGNIVQYVDTICDSVHTLTSLDDMQAFITHIKDARFPYFRDRTIIKVPSNTAKHTPGWAVSSVTQARHMDTVILDTEVKKRVIDDMNDYLNPQMLMWYAVRGIPLRRGYLFAGPPGTGKTSF